MTDLKALAEAATPGPWTTHLVDGTTVIGPDGGDVCTTCDSSQAEREDAYNVEYERMEADAAFIAAANPAAILALYAERDEAIRRGEDQFAGWVKCDVERKEAVARAEAAEASLASATKEVERLRRALAEARDDMQAWQSYASDYFRDKHDAAGDLAKIDLALTKEPPHAE